MKHLFVRVSVLSSFFFLFATLYSSGANATCVDSNFQLICRAGSPPYEDCVFAGSTQPCRGPAAATNECECRVVTTPPDQREIDSSFNLGEVEKQALPTFKFAGKTVGDIVGAILPALFTIAGLLLLLYLVYGGFSLMMSRGDPKAMEAAKGKITNAAIGFTIVFTAYWLVQLLGQVLGIEQFKLIFG